MKRGKRRGKRRKMMSESEETELLEAVEMIASSDEFIPCFIISLILPCTHCPSPGYLVHLS